VRYFLDTEFIERPGLLDLISVAIVAEDGRELYAVSSECDHAEADEWVCANVLPKLPPRETWIPRSEIAKAILAIVAGDDKPEFWAYFADYDWVLFCWLFGRMVDLPKGWPMFCMDLKQSMVGRGLTKSDLPKMSPDEEHDALADARWLRGAHAVVHQAPSGRDPDLYMHLAEPRASKEDAGGSLDAFMAEVHTARVKHRIPELLVLPVVYWKDRAGAIEPLGSTAFYGDQRHSIPIAATALRRFKQDHDRRIAEMAGLVDEEAPADVR
jgi:hypothetical protein